MSRPADSASIVASSLASTTELRIGTTITLAPTRTRRRAAGRPGEQRERLVRPAVVLGGGVVDEEVVGHPDVGELVRLGELDRGASPSRFASSPIDGSTSPKSMRRIVARSGAAAGRA